MLRECEEHAWCRDQWYRRGNTFEFNFVCNLRPLEERPAVENLEKLMKFHAAVARLAPWPQVHAVAEALAQPLSEEDRRTLLPYLQWPGAPQVGRAGRP